MNNQPMSDERLALIRSEVGSGWGDRTSYRRYASELLAEVERLRAWQVHTVERVRDTTGPEHTRLLIDEDTPEHDFGVLIDRLKQQRDEARAALARVTELHVRWNQGFGKVVCAHCNDHTDSARKSAYPCATIRAVAAGEQADLPRCIHCQQPIRSDDGRFWVHADGVYRGKARCDPDDSGVPYGHNAHPDVASGESVGCLCRGEQTEGDDRG